MDPKHAKRHDFYARVAGNTAWLTAGLFATSVSLFLTQVLLSRKLGKADWGMLAFVISVVNIFLYFSDLGLSFSVPKRIARALGRGDLDEAHRTAGSALVLQVAAAMLFSGMLFFGAETILGALLKLRELSGAPVEGAIRRGQLVDWLHLLSVWVLLFPMVRILMAFYDSFQRMRYTFLGSLLREPVKLLLVAVAVAAFVSGDRWVAVLALSAAPILALHLGLFALFRRRIGAFGFRFDAGNCRSLFVETLHFYLPYVGLWLFTELVCTLAGVFDSPETVGKLKNCLIFAGLAFVTLGAVPRAALPAFSEKADDKEVVHAGFLGMLKCAGLVNLLVFLAMSAFGANLVELVFSSKYPAQEIGPLMVLVALGSFFEAYRFLTDPLLQGSGHVKATAAVELVRVVLFVALSWFVVPRWPLYGIGFTYCVATLAADVGRLAMVRLYVLKLPWKGLAAVKLLAVAATAAAMLQWMWLFWVAVGLAVLVQVVQFTRAEMSALRHAFGTVLRSLPGMSRK